MSYLNSPVKNPTRESVSVSPPLRVLIADDHPLFRMGLRYALRVQGFIVVAEASDGREAVEAVKAHELEVALLDVKMPVLDGIQACEQITELKRRVLVVMLTTFEEPAIIKAAKEAGATAYLSKETDPRRTRGDAAQDCRETPRRLAPARRGAEPHPARGAGAGAFGRRFI